MEEHIPEKYIVDKTREERFSNLLMAKQTYTTKSKFVMVSACGSKHYHYVLKIVSMLDTPSS